MWDYVFKHGESDGGGISVKFRGGTIVLQCQYQLTLQKATDTNDLEDSTNHAQKDWTPVFRHAEHSGGDGFTQFLPGTLVFGSEHTL